MSVQTQVIWNFPVDPDTINALEAQSQILAAEGKEIGEPIKTGTPTEITIVRTWIDSNTALSWIATVEPYNPISATILN